jgi:DNA polymerase elongation subunit (family B)
VVLSAFVRVARRTVRGIMRAALAGRDASDPAVVLVGAVCNTIRRIDGARRLGVVARYCVWDTELTVRIFCSMLMWIGTTIHARVSAVSIFDTHMKGELVQRDSEIYQHMTRQGVICNNSSRNKGDDVFLNQGATVIHPVQPCTALVCPFDFESLYPTMMMAYNICVTTHADNPEIPDGFCGRNIIMWSEHFLCRHDPDYRAKVLARNAATRSKIAKTRSAAVKSGDAKAVKAAKAAQKRTDNRQMTMNWDNQRVMALQLRRVEPTLTTEQALAKAAIITPKTILPGSTSAEEAHTAGLERLIVAEDEIPAGEAAAAGADPARAAPCSTASYTDTLGHRTATDPLRAHPSLARGYTEISEPIVGGSCCEHSHRYLRADILQGQIPTVVSTLIAARKVNKALKAETDARLRDMAPDDPARADTKRLKQAYDMRQLRCKISCNAMYGVFLCGFGRGSFAKGGVSITAFARRVLRASMLILQANGATLQYGDTDSAYVRFDAVVDETRTAAAAARLDEAATEAAVAKAIYAHARRIEALLNPHFPPPVRMVFEGYVFRHMFFFSKKRYVGVILLEDGTIRKSMEKRGIVASRRDNCKFARMSYRIISHMLLNLHRTFDEVAQVLVDRLDAFCRRSVSMTEYMISMKVKALDAYAEKPLPTDPAARAAKLAHSLIPASLPAADQERLFRLRTCPAHVELAARMRHRGCTVDSRLFYVITTLDGPGGLLWRKLEDPAWLQAPGSLVCPTTGTTTRRIDIDVGTYLQKMSTDFNGILAIAFPERISAAGLTVYDQQVALRRTRIQIHRQLHCMWSRPVVFVDDPLPPTSVAAVLQKTSPPLAVLRHRALASIARKTVPVPPRASPFAPRPATVVSSRLVPPAWWTAIDRGGSPAVRFAGMPVPMARLRAAAHHTLSVRAPALRRRRPLVFAEDPAAGVCVVGLAALLVDAAPHTHALLHRNYISAHTAAAAPDLLNAPLAGPVAGTPKPKRSRSPATVPAAKHTAAAAPKTPRKRVADQTEPPKQTRHQKDVKK